MSSENSKKLAVLRGMLSLTFLEGIVALVFHFWERSMDKNAWLLGYSKSRLFLGVLILILIIIFLTLSIKAWCDSNWLKKVCHLVEERLTDDLLTWLIVFIIFVLVIGVAFAIILSSSLGNYVSVVQAIFRRSLSLLIWGGVCIIQLGIVLLINYSERLKQIKWKDVSIFRPLLVFTLILISFLHWTILFFRLDLLTSISGWFWLFHQKSYSPRDALLLIIFLLPLAFVFFILKKPGRKSNLLILILLGLFLQYAFGFVEGGGFDSIRRKFSDTQHSTYAMHACDKPDLYQAIANYETAYGDQRYLQTKPPGVLTFYVLTQKLSNLIRPQKTFDGRFQRLTWFIVFTYPLISMLVLIVLYELMKPLIGRENAILPCILYIFSPNVILMPLYLDQVLYPLVFTAGALLFMRMIKKRSVSLAILAGIGCYMAMFLSFSLLTILPFAFVLVGLDYLVNHKERRLSEPLKVLFGLALGVILAYVAFRLFLNYDIFIRYENMMIVHRYDDFVARFGISVDDAMLESGFKPGFKEILYAVFLNNITFAAWAGFAVYLLFIVYAIKLFFPFIHRKASDLEVLLGGFIITFVALNLFGDTTGEVARLWIFMLPMILIYAALETIKLFRQKNWGFYLVVGLQLITTILTYKFQDFIL